MQKQELIDNLLEEIRELETFERYALSDEEINRRLDACYEALDELSAEES